MRKKRFVGFSVAILAIVALVSISVACNRGDDTGTSPSIDFPSTTSSSGNVSSAPAPAPQTVVEPPANDPGHPEVVYDQQGVGTILNPKKHDVTYRTCVFDAALIRAQIYLGQSNPVTAPPGSDNTQIPFPELDLQCGTTYHLQVDPWKSTTDCPKDAYSIDERGKFIDITTDDCNECEEEWEEQKPETEYGEWGECEPVLTTNTVTVSDRAQCARSKTNTVTIYEVNSCTEERRIKSQEEQEETESCECTDPCGESFLDVDVRINNQGKLGYRVQSSKPGMLIIGGRQFPFDVGDTGVVIIGEPECGQTIQWSAQTRCDEDSGEVSADECELECEYDEVDNFCGTPGFTASTGTPPGVECGWLGLSPLGKDEDSPFSPADRDATAAIVKAGRCWTFFYDVEQGDPLFSHSTYDISHVTYCGCLIR